jgi:hypothetical protein
MGALLKVTPPCLRPLSARHNLSKFSQLLHGVESAIFFVLSALVNEWNKSAREDPNNNDQS